MRPPQSALRSSSHIHSLYLTLFCLGGCTAANRRTRSDLVLGDAQRITGAEALHAVTLGAAYQFFEEATKGSIEVGKAADFVVLSDNPTTVDPIEIKDIRVEETIKDGVTVFASSEPLP